MIAYNDSENLSIYTGLLIFRGKKKSADFVGFLQEKSPYSQKNRLISWDFSGKKSNFEGFSGKNSQKNRPISREMLGRNLAKKQSVKNSRFCWIFLGKFR